MLQGNQDKMEIANENLRADMERWRVEKKNDLKKLLIKMADQHMQYYQEVSLDSSRLGRMQTRNSFAPLFITGIIPHMELNRLPQKRLYDKLTKNKSLIHKTCFSQ